MTCLHIISRATARSLGMARYFTGQPCKRGHVVERLVTNATCAMCARLAVSGFYSRNREGIRAKQGEYFAANRERVNARALAWYHGSEANKGNNATHCRLRRALRLGATPSWFGELDAFVLEEAGTLARLRAERFGFPWHVDHMIPLKGRKACGLHCASNVQVIPAAVNISKGNRLVFTEPFEWIGWWAGRESNPRSAD